MLRIFVYGTLKRGYGNHQRYCQGFVKAEPATVRGRLYRLPPGYPILVVPEADILATGSSDHAADMELYARLSRESCTIGAAEPLAGDWQAIAGEMITFDDPLVRLPPLDALENFRPGRPSTYLRVLVQTEGPSREIVWTYVAPGSAPPADAPRLGTSWP